MFKCVFITCDVFIEARSSHFKGLIEKIAVKSQRTRAENQNKILKIYLQSSIRNAMIGLLVKLQNLAYTAVSLVWLASNVYNILIIKLIETCSRFSISASIRKYAPHPTGALFQSDYPPSHASYVSRINTFQTSPSLFFSLLQLCNSALHFPLNQTWSLSTCFFGTSFILVYLLSI